MGHKGVVWVYLVKNKDKLTTLVNKITHCNRMIFKLTVIELVKKFSCKNEMDP